MSATAPRTQMFPRRLNFVHELHHTPIAHDAHRAASSCRCVANARFACLEPWISALTCTHQNPSCADLQLDHLAAICRSLHPSCTASTALSYWILHLEIPAQTWSHGHENTAALLPWHSDLAALGGYGPQLSPALGPSPMGPVACPNVHQ